MSLAPMKVQMLGFSSNLEWFAVWAVYCPLKLTQVPPLDAVAPPDEKPEASHWRFCVYETEDRDAFQS